MKTEELLAAIEVSEAKTVPPIEDAWDIPNVSVPTRAWLSAKAVALLYRSLLDDGPITDEVLRECGLRWVTHDGIDEWSCWVMNPSDETALCYYPSSNRWTLSEADHGGATVNPPRTAGELRLLVRAMKGRGE